MLMELTLQTEVGSKQKNDLSGPFKNLTASFSKNQYHFLVFNHSIKLI